MNTNEKFFEKEPCFFRTKKDDFCRISINSNEISTHSDIRETKCNSKIFKIQKYVKSGKFENKILSEDEFSDEENEGELKKKISPYSKVNFSKLRNKEKTQRYLMMRKLVNKLNCKLKSLEKQVSKNPCSLLDKLAEMKISKLEKLRNKSRKELTLKKEEKENSDKFKFENLVKAAKKLYFYEDFEFSDEKNLLNLLFRLLDNEKINLNSFHFNKIINILRIVKKINTEKNIYSQQMMKQTSSDQKYNSNMALIRKSEQKVENLDLSLNESISEEEDYPLMNLKFKVIEDEDSELKIQDSESMILQITQKDLNVIENCNNQNEILSIIFNLDDKKNIHFNQKSKIYERCELKIKNNFDTCKNKNKKIKSTGIKKKKLKIKNFIEKNEDLICPSNQNTNKNKNLKEELDNKIIEEEKNELYTYMNQTDSCLNNPNQLNNNSQINKVNNAYYLNTNNHLFNNNFDIRSHLLNTLNENILKTNEYIYKRLQSQLKQESPQNDLYRDNTIYSFENTHFNTQNNNCSNNIGNQNIGRYLSMNPIIYNCFLPNYNFNNNTTHNSHIDISQDENFENKLLNNKTNRDPNGLDLNNKDLSENVIYCKNKTELDDNCNSINDANYSYQNMISIYKALYQLATQNHSNK